MKNLLVFLLVIAGAGLFFHDKQQTADLAKAQADNAALAQKLSDKEAAFNNLQARMAQLSAQGSLPATAAPGTSRPAPPNQGAWRLKESGGLDRPPY